MSKKQFFIGLFIASLFGGLVATGLTWYVAGKQLGEYPSISDRQQLVLTHLKENGADIIVPEGMNFVDAAAKVTPGVVHIRSQFHTGEYTRNPLLDLFGDMPYQQRRGPGQSSGSGVIVSDDGYIVTNNHVIENASKVEVTLNDNRAYEAKIVGADPNTDLALLKIEERNLPFITYGDSDKVRPGEWVLAVGNPFNLNSTVTAGIVSAKARNIGILRNQNNLQIESFIQTDAAVNPGNSGGALVNLRGELVGINTAIATPTGSYAGYSFAVPVTLVKKVMDDLAEFGEVQRGMMGVLIEDVNARLAREEKLTQLSGVFIRTVNEKSAAADAGMKPGDVITGVNGRTITNVSELQEMIARHRPGDTVKVTYRRGGKEMVSMLTLKNSEGRAELVRRENTVTLEGATFETLSADEARKLQISGGVRVMKLNAGKWKRADAKLREGFIITHIDKTKVDSVQELTRQLENKRGGVLIEGIYENGDKGLYAIEW
jgi:serine protease Do